MAPKNKLVGGCGCANAVQQSGGSLASDAVVSLVDSSAWAAMDAQATNQFAPMHGGIGLESGGMVGSLMRTTATLLQKPMTAGSSQSLHDLILSNTGGSAKKSYVNVMKKYGGKVAKGGSHAAAPPAAAAAGYHATIESANSLVSFLSPNFTNVLAKLVMSGGGSNGNDPSEPFSANAVLDHLTLGGAKAIGKLLKDNGVFKSGKSIVQYVGEGAKFASGGAAKETAAALTGQHGGSILDFLSTLSAANLDKVSALVGGKSSLSSITSFVDSASANYAKKTFKGLKKKLPLTQPPARSR